MAQTSNGIFRISMENKNPSVTVFFRGRFEGIVGCPGLEIVIRKRFIFSVNIKNVNQTNACVFVWYVCV